MSELTKYLLFRLNTWDMEEIVALQHKNTQQNDTAKAP